MLVTPRSAWLPILGVVVGAAAWTLRATASPPLANSVDVMMSLAFTAAAVCVFPARVTGRFWAPDGLQLLAHGFIGAGMAFLMALIWRLRHKRL